MAYDFKNLSPYDFEVLCRDLLQKELGVRLESFKTGRDKGIDLRHSKDNKNQIISQCKHYAGSTIQNLLANLKKEFFKVQKLNPQRYVVCTSLSLGVGDKEKIRQIFGHYIENDSDIFGNEDLNNLLNIHKEIQKQHFKLWLSNSEMLQLIVNSEMINRSKFLTESITRKAPLYVENKSLPRAMDILHEHGSCIVSGPPGIGKTTLAEMVLLEHARSGYEVIEISEMDQAYKIFDSNKAQIFFHDDFLGRTFLADSRQSNQTKETLQFIERISRSKNHRFLMTTREYILQQAYLLNEEIGTSNLSVKKCVLDISLYTNRIRAKILLNYLYFSDLPSDFIDEILVEKRYVKIIRHKNFNPRIVEWMTSVGRIRGMEKEKYFKQFLNFLDHPMELWKYSFNIISTEAQLLVLTLGTLPGEVLEEDLNASFLSAYNSYSKKFNLTKRPGAFFDAVKETEGTFIISSRTNGDCIIRFHSPSVKDFVNLFLPANLDYEEVFLEAPVFFDQVVQINNMNVVSAGKRDRKIYLPISEAQLTGFFKQDWSKKSVRNGRYSSYLHYTPERVLRFWFESSKGDTELHLIRPQFDLLMKRLEANSCDIRSLSEIVEFMEKNPTLYFDSRDKFIAVAKQAILSSFFGIEEIEYAISLKSKFEDHYTDDDSENLFDAIYEFVKTDVCDFLSTESDLENLEEYKETLTSIGDEYDLDVGHYVTEIEDHISELQAKENDDQDYEPDYYDRDHLAPDISDEEMSEMFGSLKK